jgi:NhaP-type Na+/H+ or K+/H+ antiporter
MAGRIRSSSTLSRMQLSPETTALSIGLAMAIGVLAQVVARHLLMPGIVLLLACGVLVGPDVLNLVRPAELGQTVQTIVGFAVAIILFEGGLNLDLRRLREEAVVIRRLVTIGAVITGAGGTLAARMLMDWDWTRAVLFGTLVIVTGPTVVTPLLRRLKVKTSVSTILEAEGVLIDPIGAIIAVVALEVLTAGSTTLWGGLAQTGIVLGGGAAVGAAGGVIIALLLRTRRIIPEGLENIFVLSFVIALFQISEAVLNESGLATVVAAGMVVGSMGKRATASLLEFKEQLTVLMIGLLFVLLAADVRMSEVQALGLPALWTVAALMFVVRPIQVWFCTIGSKLTYKERAFLAYLAPRGIVAAAVASLFAQTLAEREIPGGEEMRSLVFMVIAVTVTVQGLTGGLVAKMLGVRRPPAQGFAILGANPLSLTLGRLLREEQPDIVFIDSNPDAVLRAQRDGFRVLYGQGLHAAVLARAMPDAKLGAIALTPNAEVNLLWVNRVYSETRQPHLYVSLRPGPRGIPPETAHEAHATVLFGWPQHVDVWSERLEREEATLSRWRFTRSGTLTRETLKEDAPEEDTHTMLILTVRRSGRVRPFDDETSFREKDEADVAIMESNRTEAETWLRDHGWTPVAPAVQRKEGEPTAVA